MIFVWVGSFNQHSVTSYVAVWFNLATKRYIQATKSYKYYKWVLLYLVSVDRYGNTICHIAQDSLI